MQMEFATPGSSISINGELLAQHKEPMPCLKPKL